jgi:hypothetical protein
VGARADGTFVGLVGFAPKMPIPMNLGADT